MAKKTASKKKTSGKKTPSKKGASKKSRSKKATSKSPAACANAAGKHLVIVESPAKAKTINKYLGDDFVVKASVGHVRDLPSKNPKGVKAPVPGVDLEENFEPSYEVLSGKNKTVTELRRAAKQAADIWFATDMDREGEAIAWHLAELLGIDATTAKRVVFNAITRDEIRKAFDHPHGIDMDKVDAQQARRILDRIVGYQVSPLLWKKVARGLSAGRVQSVAVRLVVDREREIRAHVPDETWAFSGRFSIDPAAAPHLVSAWADFITTTDDKGKTPTIKEQNRWLTDHGALKADLVTVGGKDLSIGQEGRMIAGDPADIASPVEGAEPADLTPEVARVAELAGLTQISVDSTENPEGKGPARYERRVAGSIDPATPYTIKSIETKPTTTRPRAPFITSTLQQAASSFLGFNAQRTMRTAQRLYEGVDLGTDGTVGLITYMRTDSTHLSGTALDMARNHIEREYGPEYLPEKPNFYGSSNKSAQEAHEAIRPTSIAYPPEKIAKHLGRDEQRLYELIWKRFISCQMTPARFNSTTVLIEGGTDPNTPVVFRTSGRILVFDGWTRVAGLPSSDEQVLPDLNERDPLGIFGLDPNQKFSAPPARYSEASLIKVLEAEGIGRPSTYASIIGVIQDRKYVEQVDRRFYATDLGEVVTDKLREAFPDLLELGYTREMESELDKIESDHLNWRELLGEFYQAFKPKLEAAHEDLTHAKAETRPAPYECAKCGAATVYRFGKNGRFLSCSRYPDCDYACPVDREGKPLPAEYVNVKCPKTGRPMIKKTGRFGPFITTELEDGEPQDTGVILNIDKKGKVKGITPPPLETYLECPTCGSPLNLRSGLRGPWLGCSRFPKCKGRGKWAELDDEKKQSLENSLHQHEQDNPVPIITTLDGRQLTDDKGRPLPDAPTVDDLMIDDPAEYRQSA